MSENMAPMPDAPRDDEPEKPYVPGVDPDPVQAGNFNDGEPVEPVRVIFPHKCFHVEPREIDGEMVEADCDEVVEYDDEPYCSAHVLPDGAQVGGFSARSQLLMNRAAETRLPIEISSEPTEEPETGMVSPEE